MFSRQIGSPFCSTYRFTLAIRGRDGKRYRIGEISWIQLSSLQGSGPAVLHLSEAVRFALGNGLSLFIEPTQSSFQLVEAVVDCLRACGGIPIANILTFAARKKLLFRARELERGI